MRPNTIVHHIDNPGMVGDVERESRVFRGWYWVTWRDSGLTDMYPRESLKIIMAAF